MPAGGSLVYIFWQIAHLGHPVADLLAEQHAAAAWLGTLPDDDFDGVRLPQVVRIHAVSRGQKLVEQLV